MRFLVIGSGAREHALAHKLAQSQIVKQLFVWPGNALSRKSFEVLPADIAASWRDALLVAKDMVDIVVVGPETLLAEGIADFGRSIGIAVFGPTQEVAQLESSKAFSKEVMAKAKIPTAPFEIVTSREQCLANALRRLERSGGIVIKASGLAAGKGVFVCFDEDAVRTGVERLYTTMAEAARTVVLEDVLRGRECSFFCMLGEGEPLEVGFAVDFKRLRDGDEGPNTGGMGCYTPVPWLPKNANQVVMERVVHPLIQELKLRNLTYTGWLYVGLMWSEHGPSVVEFNVRFGDPEAEVLVFADDADWGALIASLVGKRAASADVLQAMNAPKKAAVCVVMASAGYPYGDGERAPQVLPTALLEAGSAKIFAAAVTPSTDQSCIATGKGRVFTVVGSADDIMNARRHAYEAVSEIARTFSDAQWRTDIAAGVAAQKVT